MNVMFQSLPQNIQNNIIDQDTLYYYIGPDRSKIGRDLKTSKIIPVTFDLLQNNTVVKALKHYIKNKKTSNSDYPTILDYVQMYFQKTTTDGYVYVLIVKKLSETSTSFWQYNKTADLNGNPGENFDWNYLTYFMFDFKK